MSDGADKYLTRYARTGRPGRTGLLASPAALLRERLDLMAQATGQVDRFALFLQRAAQLCGHTIDDHYTVLDLGAADGWALTFNRPGLRRVAIDASDVFARDLAAKEIEFHKCDIATERLPIDTGEADLVMMHHVIEHIRDPAHLMTECARVLRKGGGLYLRTPNMARAGAGFWDDYTHVKPYTVNGLCGLTSAFGFSTRCLFASTDHTRICLDLLLGGRLRAVTMHGKEIEVAFSRD